MNDTTDFDRIIQYKISRKPLEECLAEIISWLAGDKKCKTFVCANPHSLVVADEDPEFKACFEQADLVTPDGIGMVYASKVLGGAIGQRVSGPDIFTGLSLKLNSRGVHNFSYFFMGSTDETLERIRRKLAKDFPNINFAGSYSPPYKAEFSQEDHQGMIEAINAAKPDILWVGLTAPKQEKWIFQNKDKLNVKFIGAIGAGFDYYAGNIKSPHPIFVKLGLQWLHRFLQEPRRLWRRNFISNPKFVIKVIVQRLREGSMGE